MMQRAWISVDLIDIFCIESMIQNYFNFDVELTFYSGDTTAFTFLSVIHMAKETALVSC